jgi:hypothetical protein
MKIIGVDLVQPPSRSVNGSNNYLSQPKVLFQQKRQLRPKQFSIFIAQQFSISDGVRVHRADTKLLIGASRGDHCTQNSPTLVSLVRSCSLKPGSSEVRWLMCLTAMRAASSSLWPSTRMAPVLVVNSKRPSSEMVRGGGPARKAEGLLAQHGLKINTNASKCIANLKHDK